jgi:hypothetical protein
MWPNEASVMTKEIRYLAFSNEELSMALAKYRRSQANPFPGDTIENLNIIQMHGHFILRVFTNGNQPGKGNIVQIEQHEVLSALIFFCKHQGIPLAMKAYKSLEVIGDQIAMLTTANFTYDRPEEKHGSIVYTDDDLEHSKQGLKSP